MKRVRNDNPIVETNVEIFSLVNKSMGKCGNQGIVQTLEYNPCRMITKGAKSLADIFANGSASLKGTKFQVREGLRLTKSEYKRASDNKESVTPMIGVRRQYIIYGLIAVAGYFAYKKFKK